MPIANARMYSVEATSAAAWRSLLEWVARRADVPMRYEPHAAPAPLPTLWRRPDLGCAFMCGYPLATWSDAAVARPHVLAAIVPRGTEGGRPAYRTAIVTRAEGGIAKVEDLLGRRFAYTTPDSQSGYQAVRHWFAQRPAGTSGSRFAATVGPLLTPRAVVEAVLRGEADAGPLDGYWLSLLERHEPGTAAKLRTLACTDWTPVPPFVCSASIAPPTRQRVVEALLAAGAAPELAETRAALDLASIVRVPAEDYDALAARARAADDLGYPVLQ